MCQHLSLIKQEAINIDLYKIVAFSWEADSGKSNDVGFLFFYLEWNKTF